MVYVEPVSTINGVLPLLFVTRDDVSTWVREDKRDDDKREDTHDGMYL